MTINFDRVPWLGGIALIVSAFPGIYFLKDWSMDHPVSLSSFSSKLISSPSLHIDLPLCQNFAALPIGNVTGQIFFSIDPMRPDSDKSAHQFLVRLATSNQIRRIELPSRLNLAFNASGILQFSDTDSSFWIDCKRGISNELSVCLSYIEPDGQIVEQAEWSPSLQEPPFQSCNEFPENSSFRYLAETRWWGQDLLMEKNSPGACVQRLEIGPFSKADIIDCSLKDWLVFKDNKWQKLNSLQESEGLPLARIKKILPQSLEIEGWNELSYVRLKLPLGVLPALKIKSEELFSQLRVRSEKQVSCMLDKQCLILRPGDWALKTDLRWKILRKKEEKEAALEGKLVGDLFILDRIDAKSSVKNIAGHYFSAGRTQSIPIEYSQKTQKTQKRAR